jgi:hypothetical protein
MRARSTIREAPRARTAALGGALLASFHATASVACPVCFSAQNPDVLSAYYLTAALLTGLPFVIAGVFALWLRSHARRMPEA